LQAITDNPFPFPYAQMISGLLVFHFFATPVLIGMIPINCVWCFIFAFVSVFSLCALNLIAQEIENPFGDDANDLHCDQAQAQMNEALLLLMTAAADSVPNFNMKAEADRPKPDFKSRKTRRLSHFLPQSDGAGSEDRRPSVRASSRRASKRNSHRKSVDIAMQGRVGNGAEDPLHSDALKSEANKDHAIVNISGGQEPKSRISQQDLKKSDSKVVFASDVTASVTSEAATKSQMSEAAPREATMPALSLSPKHAEPPKKDEHPERGMHPYRRESLENSDYPSHQWAQLQASFERSDKLQKQGVSELQDVHVMLGQLVDMVSQGLSLATDGGVAVRALSEGALDTGRIVKSTTDKSKDVGSCRLFSGK